MQLKIDQFIANLEELKRLEEQKQKDMADLRGDISHHYIFELHVQDYFHNSSEIEGADCGRHLIRVSFFVPLGIENYDLKVIELSLVNEIGLAYSQNRNFISYHTGWFLEWGESSITNYQKTALMMHMHHLNAEKRSLLSSVLSEESDCQEYVDSYMTGMVKKQQEISFVDFVKKANEDYIVPFLQKNFSSCYEFTHQGVKYNVELDEDDKAIPQDFIEINDEVIQAIALGESKNIEFNSHDHFHQPSFDKMIEILRHHDSHRLSTKLDNDLSSSGNTRHKPKV